MITTDFLTTILYCCLCSFRDFDPSTLANKRKEILHVKDNVSSQLLCYSCSSWQRMGVSACAQLEVSVLKAGSTCESKTDLDE